MEYNGNGFLEEILALRNDQSSCWEATNIPLIGMNDYFYNTGWSNFDNSLLTPQNTFFEDFSVPLLDHQSLNCSLSTHEFYLPLGEQAVLAPSAPELTDSSTNKLETSPFPTQEVYSSLPDIVKALMDDDDDDGGGGGGDLLQVMGNHNGYPNIDNRVLAPCKMEPIFNMGSVCLEKKSKFKKSDGQPSKNLMAERRRRKRLNDRLSMLRSVVPKISKMDRTSILGDTIDYMKELLERISSMQEEIEVLGNPNHLNLINIFKDVKPNYEIFVRNSPKFDVERRNTDTRIEICCAGKPGLLLSTVTTLEALGFDIHQCVISCFNDFSLQASCSEQQQQGGILSTEDIKQELFRNAGYGGKCL